MSDQSNDNAGPGLPDDAKAKRATFEAALANCYRVHVIVLKHPAVQVPEGLWQPALGHPEIEYLVLEYGLELAKPIPDLDVTDEGIRATLSFSNEPRATFVPWEAVARIDGLDERPKQRAKLRLV
jgi:hypothetical protein